MKSLTIVVLLSVAAGVIADDDVSPECADQMKKVMAKEFKSSESSEYHEPDVSTLKATFGMDCFWGVESVFGGLPGVIRVKAGYTGGQKDNPTYRSLGDHTESVEIEFDPKRTTFADLLKAFWSNHDATEAKTTQYMSAVFYHDDGQKKLAVESKEDLEMKLGAKTLTRISPAGVFYDAEDYHQKYFLRQHENLVTSLGLTDKDFLNSWRTTRLLGFITGHGDVKTLDEEWRDLGLTEEQTEYVKMARSSRQEGSCSALKDEL